MYEFLFDKVASLDANQLHENIIFMEATLKKEIEKNRDNLSNSSIEYFERVIQYIKSGVNVTINLNELDAEKIDLNLVQNLINNSAQLQIPLNIYITGGSVFNKNSEDNIDMLFDDKTLSKLEELNNFLIKNNQNPLKFLEDTTYPESAWTLEEVQNANKSIDVVVDFIKKNNLSPYEAAAFIHKIASSTFQYKEDEQMPVNARSIVGITNTDKIVCVGYARFTKSVIDKLNMKGLECETFISTLTPTKFDSEICEELNISPFGTGHMQNLIKINDDKYKVKGVYASDACWDSKTKYFPSGKGYGNFMFPVTDLISYAEISFRQPKDGLESLLQICNIDTETVPPEEIPVIKENLKKSKPIPMDKLKRCLTNLYKHLYTNANEEEIHLRVERAIEVSKIVSRSIFTETAQNAISREAYHDLYYLDEPSSEAQIQNK